MRSLWKRCAAMFRARSLERDLEDEISTHLAMQEEEFRARGMSDAEARAAARREFGGVTQIAESYRDQRGLPWLESTGQDVRYGLRGLLRHRGFTAAAVLSLALGIGANTAIFSMYHSLLLRRLPVENPQELVTLYRTGGWGVGYCSYPLYLDMRKRADLFTGVIGCGGVEKVAFRSGAADRSESVQRELVTGNYFAVLGVKPAIGRLYRDDDNRTPHAHPLAVLSYDFWQRRFGGDPAVLGRTVVVGRDPLTIVGVAGRGFRGVEVEHHPDLWEPAMMSESDTAEPGSNWLWILARRRADVSVQQAQAAVQVQFQQYLNSLYGNQPNAAFRKTAMDQRLDVREGGVGLSSLRENFQKPLRILLVAVWLVLLAACTNVANLLLARGAARQKEIAVRLSIGATRGRLVRQAFTESLLLALMGSALAIILAFWGVRAIAHFLPAAAGEPFGATPDLTALAFTIGVTVVAAVLFGLIPAWRSTSVDPAECMKGGASTAPARHAAVRHVLVVAQVAFSVMLVVLAGLFSHSLAALRSIDLGFRNQSVIASSIDFPAWKGAEQQTGREKFLARLEALPGVSGVSFGSPGPYRGGFSKSSLRVPGSELTAREPAWVSVQQVAPRYFEILGSTPVQGREFTRSDAAGSPKVAIVNQAFVREFLPGERYPLHRVLNFDESHPDPVSIVGVVRDIPHQGLREKVAPTVYLPVTQNGTSFGAVLLVTQRTREEIAAELRQEVERLGPEASASEPKTLRQRIDDSIFQDRLIAMVGGFFGGLALLLAAIGLYGVMAYAAARRSREIGIRIAMGARRSAVLWMVLRGSLALVLAGLAIGIPVSWLAAGKVAPILFGIPPGDSITFVTTIAVLLAVGLSAALLPARRAASLDPMKVLRTE